MDQPISIFDYLPLAALKPDPANPRSHSKRQIRAIADSIEAFGFNAPILINSEKQIVAGHGRLAAAKLLGLEKVPTVNLRHLTAAQTKAYMIADNKLNDLSIFDEKALAAVLKDLSAISLEFDVEATGFAIPEIDKRIHCLDGDMDLDDADEIRIEQGPAITQPGDVWVLGKHRVACGDALDPGIYEAVLKGSTAHAVFADFPYNLKVNGVVSGNGKIRHREFAMASGEMTRGEFATFLSNIFKNLKSRLSEGALVYACMDWRSLEELSAAARGNGLETANLCVWVKTNGGLGSFYRSQHELIYVFRNGHAPHRNNVQLGRFGRNRTNVWNYPGANVFAGGERNRLLKLHPTVKPLRLVADAILDCTAPGQTVLDCFLGSGTTVLAAERTGRIAAGIEMDPLYVDTTVRRWQEMTGDNALHSSGEPFNSLMKTRTISSGVDET